MYILPAIVLLSIVLIARMANKWRLPLVVIALGAGIVFGSDISGLIYFDNAVFAKQIADFALIFVLFVGGFGTRKEALKTVFGSSLLLSTIGVMITAGVTTGLLCLILGYSFTHALLLGCIISSTDAAAVFSILRSRTLQPRLSALTEIESATNDPMAILLTTTAIQLISIKLQNPLTISFMVVWQLAAGIGIGMLIGKLSCMLFERIKIIDRGYFFIYLIGVILLSYSAADLVKASGMLAAFFCGYVMGNSAIPHKKNISTFLEALAAMANVVIFVLLGLLVFPKEFGRIWVDGLVLFVIITFAARPVAVLVCTAKSTLTIKDKGFLTWSGLRGAVPIVLATYPVAAGLEDSRDIFNIVFFAVALSMLIQGTTISKVADKLKLATKAKRKPNQVMELVTLYQSDLELAEIVINDDDYEGTVRISILDLPEGTTISMINRNDIIIAPRGSTLILPGDVLYVLTKNAEIEIVANEIYRHFKVVTSDNR